MKVVGNSFLAPEIENSEGKEAKAFVGKILHPSSGVPKPPAIIIKTTKSDKYDRYLADVWVKDKYLNQELLEKDLALLVSE